MSNKTHWIGGERRSSRIHDSVRDRARRARIDCPSGKAAYPNIGTARSEAARISAHSGSSLTTYKCPYCDLFHLTTVRK